MPPKRGLPKDSTTAKKAAKVAKEPQPAPQSSSSAPDAYIPQSKKKGNKDKIVAQAQQRISTIKSQVASSFKQRGQSAQMPTSVSFLVGTTELQLVKLLVLERLGGDAAKFAQTLGVTELRLPQANKIVNDYVEQEVEILGEAASVAAAVVYIAYHLYNKQTALISDDVGTLDTHYSINILLNQFVYLQIDKRNSYKKSLVKVLKEQGVTNISVSNHVNYEFSNLLLIALTGTIDSLINSIATIAQESAIAKPQLLLDEKLTPAKDENDVFIPSNSYLHYHENPTHNIDANEAFLQLIKLSRKKGGTNDVLEEKLLRDSVQRNNFLRVPYLGIFEDPDLILKETV